MESIKITCPNCNNPLELQELNANTLCKYCNKPILNVKNENSASNVVIHNHMTNFNSPSEFEAEKKQCKVLLMLLNNFDIEYLKDKALKVLDINPDNSLAQMIYDCDISCEILADLPFTSINEKPLADYVKSEMGNIDVETCDTFLCLLLTKSDGDNETCNIVKDLIKNISLLNVSNQEKIKTFNRMATQICDVTQINALLQSSKLNKAIGILTMFSDSSGAMDSFSDSKNIKVLANNILSLRTKIAKAFTSELSKLNMTELPQIINKVYNTFFYNKTNTVDMSQKNIDTQSNIKENSSQKLSPLILGIRILGAALGSIFGFLAILLDSYLLLIVTAIGFLVFGLTFIKPKNKA